MSLALVMTPPGPASISVALDPNHIGMRLPLCDHEWLKCPDRSTEGLNVVAFMPSTSKMRSFANWVYGIPE